MTAHDSDPSVPRLPAEAWQRLEQIKAAVAVEYRLQASAGIHHDHLSDLSFLLAELGFTQAQLTEAEARLLTLAQDLKLNASMLARQWDLARDAENKLAAAEARLRSLEGALRTVVSEAVGFNERKQEFFCRVCRYRDPLVDGSKLHDDNCSILAIAALLGAALDPPRTP